MFFILTLLSMAFFGMSIFLGMANYIIFGDGIMFFVFAFFLVFFIIDYSNYVNVRERISMMEIIAAEKWENIKNCLQFIYGEDSRLSEIESNGLLYLISLPEIKDNEIFLDEIEDFRCYKNEIADLKLEKLKCYLNEKLYRYFLFI